MPDLDLHTPFTFHLTLVETDDRTPSFRVSLHVEIPYASETFAYTAHNLWFQTNHWDAFLRNLKQSQPATLMDMSEDFHLLVTPKPNENRLHLHCRKRSSNALASTTTLDYETSLDADATAALLAAFDLFPQWW